MKNTKKNVTVQITQEDGSTTSINIYVVRPSNNTIQNADRYRAKTWNQCIIDNILTKKELSKILEQRGIWNERKSEEEAMILSEINKLEKKLYLGVGIDGKKARLEDGKKWAVEMRKLRIELRNLIAEKLALEENTAESLSDNAKFDYFVADCTFYENGQKVYKDVNDYNSKSADEIAFAAAAALGEMLYQLDTKFEENLPENKWLKKYNLVNEDLSLIDQEGSLIDLDGKKINSMGHYVDENGKRIDRDGNPLEDDGTYIVQVEYEQDEKKEENKSKKRKQPVTE